MGRIKSWKIWHNKALLKACFMVALALILLATSFAWLYDEYVGSGASLKLGTIRHHVVQYDAAGRVLNDHDETQTVIFEKNMSNTTKNSKFIEIENQGTLPMEYSLTFTLDGKMEVAGILYYRLYEVTEEVEKTDQGSFASQLEAYANANPISPTLENETAIPVSNLTTLHNLVKIGVAPKKETGKSSVYYRLDYGVYQTVNTALYSDEMLAVHLNVYSSQVGTITEENRSGQTWEVQTEEQLRQILSAARSGDRLLFLNDIRISGTLNIPKRLDLDLNNHTLEITGDLIYDYVNMGQMSIAVTGSGRLLVGNDFIINAPKANVTITGENKNYDIVVAGEFSVNALQDNEENGMYLENVRIVKSSASLLPTDMKVLSNTRVTVGPDVDLGIVRAGEGSTNIEVINNGNIVQMDFSAMNLLDSFSKAQIYVYNLGQIYGILGSTGIVLPPTSTPYLGPNNGNTLIVKGITSGDFTVGGSEHFGSGDVEDTGKDINVVPIEGEENAYIVYIKDSTVSVEGLLTSYFQEAGFKTPVNEIAKIEKLVIYTLNAQYFENEDFDFLRSDAVPVLRFLSLANAKVIDGTVINQIKVGAMKGKTSLQTLILPKTVETIGDEAFVDSPLGYIPTGDTEDFQFLTIPSTVKEIGSRAFSKARYVKMTPISVPVMASDSFNLSDNGAKIFVTVGTIDSYRASGSLNEKYIYHAAELADTRDYFVYRVDTGLGISYVVDHYLSGTVLGIPNKISYQGSSQAVMELGVNSYRSMEIVMETGVGIQLPQTVTTIGDYAFYQLKVTSISLDNVEEVGSYAFADTKLDQVIANKARIIRDHAFQNTMITRVSLLEAEAIEDYAFASNPQLFSISLGNIHRIGNYAFYQCPQVGKVYFNNRDSIMVNNVEQINMQIGENAIFSEWGSFIDNRLRIYVPDGVSDLGTSYVDLYKALFGDNSRYVYATGIEIGSYFHYAVPYDLGEYTLKEVVYPTKEGGNVVGWEIISYQGKDLLIDYKIPTSLTANGKTHNVVSIGSNAYRNTIVADGQMITISDDNLVNIGDYAFFGLSMNTFKANSVLTVGAYAFSQSTVETAEFKSLKTLGPMALANIDTLISLHLGPVVNIGYNAVSNDANLEQLYISNGTQNIVLNGTPFSNIGTNANDRLRIYVPEDDLQYYRELLSDYATYIYATGFIRGSFVNAPILYDIGAFSVREVDIAKPDGTIVHGWELVEYHGPDLESDYVFPRQVTVSDNRLKVVLTRQGEGWGDAKNGWITTYQAIVTNMGDEQIDSWEVIINPKRFEWATIKQTAGTWHEDAGKFVLTNPSWAGRIKPGESKTMSFQFQWKGDRAADLKAQDYHARESSTFENVYPVISIGENAFIHTKVAEGHTVNFDNELLLRIGNNAFRNVQGVADFHFPNVTTIGDYAFANTTITSGTFENLKEVGSGAFDNVGNLYSINFGTVTKIPANTLTNANYLTQVFFTAQDTTLNIDAKAIKNVGSLTSDRIRFYVTDGVSGSGKSFVDIYRGLFDASYSTYFYPFGTMVGSYNPPNIPYDVGVFSVRKVSLTNAKGKTVVGWELVEYHGADIDSTFQIPEMVTANGETYPIISIGDYALLHTVILPGSRFDVDNNYLLRIGVDAFNNMAGIDRIIANEVVSIGENAFRNNQLSYASFMNLQEVGRYAFAGNANLHFINLGYATSLPEGLLQDATNLTQVWINNTNVNAASSKMNIVVGENAFSNVGSKIGDRFRFYVPQGHVTNTLRYVDAYQNILPTNISPYVYERGYIVGDYQYAAIPFNIGEYTVKEVTLGNTSGFQIIDYHGPDITDDYVIPASLTANGITKPVIAIGDHGYYFATVAANNHWNLSFSNSLKYIGNYAFYKRDLRTVSGGDLSYIGKYAFAEMTRLTNVTLGSVTMIDSHAFYLNTALTTVSLGSQVEEIGDYAFYNTWSNNSFNTFYISSVTPPKIYANTLPAIFWFWNSPTVYVPYEAQSAYKSASIWSDRTIRTMGNTYDNTYIYNIINTNEIEITGYLVNNTSSLTIPDIFTIDGVSYHVTAITDNAFDGSTRLTNLTLPQYLNTIGDRFLVNNTSITNIYVHASNASFSSIDGVLFDKSGETLMKYPRVRASSSYTLPSSTKIIATNAFTNAGSLQTVIFNENLLAISNDSFTDCDRLVNLTFTSIQPPYLMGYNTFPLYQNTRITYPTESTSAYESRIYYYKYAPYFLP